MTDQRHSAPPLREVTNAECEEHFPLVHFVLKRMMAKGQLVPTIPYEDHYQVGCIAIWDALRRFDPARGNKPSTYLSSYVWGRVMTNQRRSRKADGWHNLLGQIAQVGSYEHEVGENLKLRDTLPAPDDTAEAAEWAARWDRMHERAEALTGVRRVIAFSLLEGDERIDPIAARAGVSRSRIGQLRDDVRAYLAEDAPAPQRGTVLVDRSLHTTERDAIREVGRAFPGRRVRNIRPKKVRDGRVVSAQGRARADGNLGRPVWAAELAA